MTLFRRTRSFGTTRCEVIQLRVTRQGLVMEYRRNSTLGGTYVDNSITLPWRSEV